MPIVHAAAPAPQIPRTWAELPEKIRQRLEGEGVTTPEQWRGLGYRRREIWGLTRAHVVLIDSCSRVRM
jgi:hypothetical protein